MGQPAQRPLIGTLWALTFAGSHQLLKYPQTETDRAPTTKLAVSSYAQKCSRGRLLVDSGTHSCYMAGRSEASPFCGLAGALSLGRPVLVVIETGLILRIAQSRGSPHNGLAWEFPRSSPWRHFLSIVPPAVLWILVVRHGAVRNWTGQCAMSRGHCPFRSCVVISCGAGYFGIHPLRTDTNDLSSTLISVVKFFS